MNHQGNNLGILAARLREAENTRVPIDAISKIDKELQIRDAYQIQMINIEEKLQNGDQITGKKIGLTSLAMQNLLGVNQPDYGHLLKSMEVKEGQTDRKSMLQARAEAEIAFVLNKDLNGGGITAEDVIHATEYISAAIEIVDSRIADWKINIIDTIADNASSGRYILSPKKVDPRGIDLKKIHMIFKKNGERINEGIGDAVLGDPAYAVAWLANAMADFGVPLKKGEVILSGALSAMAPAESGDIFSAEFDELGEISVRFL